MSSQEVAARKTKDPRWFYAGVAACVVGSLGGLLFFGPSSLLRTLCSGFGIFSPDSIITLFFVFWVRSFGGLSLLLATASIIIVRSPRLLYVVSLFVTLQKNKRNPKYSHWNEILPDQLVLGAIPLHNYNHLAKLSTPKANGGVGITAVVSLLERYEFEPSFLFKPIQIQDWERNGITSYWIHTEDYEPVNPVRLLEGADFIHEQILNGGKAYVHCKAGRGRSTACCAAYLIKYHKMGFEESIEFIRQRRTQINLNKRQRQAVKECYEIVQSGK